GNGVHSTVVTPCEGGDYLCRREGLRPAEAGCGPACQSVRGALPATASYNCKRHVVTALETLCPAERFSVTSHAQNSDRSRATAAATSRVEATERVASAASAPEQTTKPATKSGAKAASTAKKSN